jgi:hypothetical protein
MARLITPPDSRGNTLFIGGQLRGFNAGPLTELVVICIYEELVTMDMADMDFAPPQELPLSTSRVQRAYCPVTQILQTAAGVGAAAPLRSCVLHEDLSSALSAPLPRGRDL